jgi:hypothetical protein
MWPEMPSAATGFQLSAAFLYQLEFDPVAAFVAAISRRACDTSSNVIK